MQSPVVVDFAQSGGDAGDDESGLWPFISNRPVIRLAENNATKSDIASKNRRRRLIHARRRRRLRRHRAIGRSGQSRDA